MTDIIVVRQLVEDLWQWRFANNRTGWLDHEVHSGDLEALSESLPHSGMPAVYLLQGENVVAQRITAEARERRHLVKLVPYQLEEQAIDPVDDLHFALGNVQDGKIAVAYTDADSLEQGLTALESAGCDGLHCVADFLLLPRPERGWVLCADGERLLVHSGTGLGLGAELDLAEAVLPALVAHQKAPEQLELCAENSETLANLQALLPESLTAGDSLAVMSREAGFWDLIDPTALPELDFRSGAFGRRLPLTRWWREWRVPLIATAAAFVIAIGVTAGQYWQSQARQDQILEDMKAVYRLAVPNATGDVQDPERRLASLVSGLGGSRSSSNVMSLLSQVAPSISSKEGLSLSSFRYSADNRELQLNLEADDFSLLEAVRTDIAERGLTAELLRVSAQGDVHQARMRVVEGS